MLLWPPSPAAPDPRMRDHVLGPPCAHAQARERRRFVAKAHATGSANAGRVLKLCRGCVGVDNTFASTPKLPKASAVAVGL